MAKTATVSQLKASLSKYLRRVKAGEEVVVTERGHPVAKLVPVGRGVEALAEQLQRMVREGRVRLGSGQLGKVFWDLPRPADPKGLVLKALLEEREKVGIRS